MSILALSGSLRAASLNSMLLRAMARLAPPHLKVQVWQGLGELPLFNPDMEALDPPPVARLRTALLASDALIIASPEYAHGVSSVMKNALDWMVGNLSLVDIPVALLNASPRATHAQAALRETLLTMSARVIDAACVAVPLLGSGLTEDGILASEPFTCQLRAALEALHEAVLERRAESPDVAPT
jgi:NAD(P)H-dependent FMN reductase